MEGADVGRLNVYVEDGLGPKELQWRLTGHQESKWMEGKFMLFRTRPFRVKSRDQNITSVKLGLMSARCAWRSRLFLATRS